VTYHFKIRKNSQIQPHIKNSLKFIFAHPTLTKTFRNHATPYLICAALKFKSMKECAKQTHNILVFIYRPVLTVT